MRAVAAPGRRVWTGIGLLTAAVLAMPGTKLITRAGVSGPQEPPATVTQTVTVTSPVTSVTVRSYGSPIRVTAGPAGRVQAVEQISYDKHAGAPPAVPAQVSAGHLTLDASACEDSGCTVSFSVTVPRGVTATLATGGGPATVSRIAGADVDSEGGPVSAARIDGPLTVSSGGGPVLVNGLAGPLRVDSQGGDVTARHVDTKIATVGTGGGAAWISFAGAPDAVTVSAEGGSVTMIVPGGPYALTADTEGGAEQFGIATDPAAPRFIKVSTGGGPMLIRPASSPVVNPG
jgi:hypothetical protein